MTNFLLELRSEEIPARMQAKARADLEALFVAQLATAGLAATSITVYSTPRRLVLIAHGLPLETLAAHEETKGPKTSAPPQALEGFLRKTGLTQDQLTERVGIYFAIIEKPGRRAADVLAAAIPAIIRSFPWPKSMRWGDASISTSSLRWVRPLSGIIALLDDVIVPFEVDGIISGRVTMGHRFHHSSEITINNAADYAAKLRAAYVIVDHTERQDIVRDGAAKAAADAGLTLVADEGLVIENAGLTEWPVPLLGRFDAAFLDVPSEVIQLTARVNQKYFVCHDTAGTLTNAFVCTANIAAHDGGAAIIAGNEKVLAARLSDAKFFWEADLKVPLEEQAAKLSQIVFHEKLGTVADKVERVAKLARWLVEHGIVKSSPERGGGSEADGGGSLPNQSSDSEVGPLRPLEGAPPRAGEDLANLADQATRAARLCKADLVTGMVGEFPELQGIMGGYYARAQGESDAVADAVRDHYKPVGQGDDVPTAPVTVAVSLADKLDTLAGFFAADEKPTGSKDPFALRRAAIGILAVLETNKIRLPLSTPFRGTYLSARLNFHLNKSELPNAKRAINDNYFEAPLLFGIYQGNAFRQSLEFMVSLNNNAVPTDERVNFVSAWENKYGTEYFETQRELVDFFSSGHEYLQLPELTNAEIIGYAEGRTSYYGTQYFRSQNEFLAFFADRLKVQQREAGVRHDLIDAVFALGQETGEVEDDLVRLLARVKALQAFVVTDEGANLLAGYKRAANILKQNVDDKNSRHPELVSGSIVPDNSSADAEEWMLKQVQHDGVSDVEVSLYKALTAAEPLAAAAILREDFAAAMTALASLRAPIDAFFEGVMVNDPDPAKRAFRIGLLTRFRDAVHSVADFSKIEG